MNSAHGWKGQEAFDNLVTGEVEPTNTCPPTNLALTSDNEDAQAIFPPVRHFSRNLAMDVRAPFDLIVAAAGEYRKFFLATNHKLEENYKWTGRLNRSDRFLAVLTVSQPNSKENST